MLAVAWPFGCPARFADSGGAQTRGAGPETCRRDQTMRAFSPEFADSGGAQTRGAGPETCRRAQTMRAFSPVHAALLGHAIRPGELVVTGSATSLTMR